MTKTNDNEDQQGILCERNNQLEVRGTRDINEDNEVQHNHQQTAGYDKTNNYVLKMMRDDNSDKERRETRTAGDVENACYVRQR